MPKLILSLALLLPTHFASAYDLLPTTPRFVCEELILGAQKGASYEGRVLNFFKRLLGWRLRVRIIGLDEILAADDGRGALVMANHSSPLCPVPLTAFLGGPLKLRPVMTGNLRGFPGTDTLLGATAGFIQPEPSSGGVTTARLIEAEWDEVANATRHGDNVFFYPSGFAQTSPYEHLAAQSMLYEVLRRDPNARIILVRVRGLWGSGTGHGAASAKPDHLLSTTERIVFGIKKAALILALNGPFAPKRPVTIELVEPKDFPRLGTREEMNAYLTEFYRGGAPEVRTFVKSHFLLPWRTIRHGDPDFSYGSADRQWVKSVAGEVDPALVGEVVKLLRKLPRLEDIDEQTDLGDRLDSLAKVDVFLAILEKFDVRLDDDAHFRDARDVAKLIAHTRSADQNLRAVVADDPWFTDGRAPWRAARRLAKWAKAASVNSVGVLGPLEPDHALARELGRANVQMFNVDWTASADEVTAALDQAGASVILTTKAILREIARSHDLSRYLHRVRLVDDPGGKPPLP